MKLGVKVVNTSQCWSNLNQSALYSIEMLTSFKAFSGFVCETESI